MRRLNSFLDRFKNLTPPEGAVKDAVCYAVKEVTGITLLTEEVTVTKERVHLRIDSVRRSEIMLSRAAILRKVSEFLPGKRVVREIL